LCFVLSETWGGGFNGKIGALNVKGGEPCKPGGGHLYPAVREFWFKRKKRGECLFVIWECARQGGGGGGGRQHSCHERERDRVGYNRTWLRHAICSNKNGQVRVCQKNQKAVREKISPERKCKLKKKDENGVLRKKVFCINSNGGKKPKKDGAKNTQLKTLW